MIDDLVKQLRESAVGWDGLGFHVDAKRDRDAADRIEQLQAALYDMMQLLPRAEWYYLKPETRAALGEKKDDRAIVENKNE
jgi:hypothetical protein